MHVDIIAEIGLNHNGSIDKAKLMITEAKKAGADIVKFQTYTMDERLSEATMPLKAVFEKCFLSYEDFVELKEFSDKCGVSFMSTPFGMQSLEFLVKKLQVDKMKISSFDLNNSKMLAYLGCNKVGTTYISTGMAREIEISLITKHLSGGHNVCVMHCVSAYPLRNIDANLGKITSIKNLLNAWGRTEWVTGYSDHTPGILVPALSVCYGVSAIEKHFTLDLNDGAVDNSVSITPKMLKQMRKKIKEFSDINGDGSLSVRPLVELGAVKYKKYA